MTLPKHASHSVFKYFEHNIKKHLQSFDLDGLTDQMLSRIAVEPPRDPAHGDLAINAAMVLAKPLGMNPRELATRLADILKGETGVVSAEIAGPGFHQFAAGTIFLDRPSRADRQGGNPLWQRRSGPQNEWQAAQGECRICVGQSDRSDACGPLPGCCGWRCAGQSAGFCRI